MACETGGPAEMAENCLKILAEIGSEALGAAGIDPLEWREVVVAERKRAQATIEYIVERREELNVPEKMLALTREEIAVMLSQWMSVMYHHRDQKRKTGEGTLELNDRLRPMAKEVWKELGTEKRSQIFENSKEEEIPDSLEFKTNDDRGFNDIIASMGLEEGLKKKIVKLWKATRHRYSVHLWEAATKAIEKGFLEPELLTAIIAHDAAEDIPEVANETVPLFYEAFYKALNIGSERGKQLSAEGWAIRKIVMGVTKPAKEGKYEDPQERNKAYFEILIRTLQESASSVIVKLVDRWHNMMTLDGQPEKKRKEVAQETIDVFVPLAECIGLDSLADELMRLALPYVGNQKLVDDFDTEMEKRVSEIENNSGEYSFQEIKSIITNAIKEAAGIEEEKIHLSLQPHTLLRRLRRAFPDKATAEVTLEDLRLAQNDTIVDIQILIDQEGDPQKVLEKVTGALQWRLPGTEWKFSQLGHNKGAYLKTTDCEAYPGFRGKIVIQTNTQQGYQRLQRGSFEWNKFETAGVIRSRVVAVLEAAKEPDTDIIAIAREILLKPTMKIEIFYSPNKILSLNVPRDTTIAQLKKILKERGEEVPLGKVYLARARLLQDWQGDKKEMKDEKVIPSAGSVIFWEGETIVRNT